MSCNILKIASLCLTLGLTSCSSSPPRPDIRLDGESIAAKEDVARLAIYATRMYPDHPMNRWWETWLVSVDGAPVPKGAAVVQLKAGHHTLEYKCHLYFRIGDTGGGYGTSSAGFILDAGKTYFPSKVSGYMSSYENFRGAGISSKGTCAFDGLSTQNPYYL